MKIKIILLILCSCLTLNAQESLPPLNQKAERAMVEKNYKKARKVYEKLLHNISQSDETSGLVNWTAYVDVILRLSHLYQNEGEFAKGERLLQTLITQNPPVELSPLIAIQQAHLKCSQNNPQEAFSLLQSVKKNVPIQEWRSSDRSFYLALTSLLNAHYESFLKSAAIHFQTKNYGEAIPLFEKILSAIEKKYYPASSLLLEKRVQYQLATCQYCQRQEPNLKTAVEETRRAFENTMDSIQGHLSSKEQKELPFFVDALFELGYLHYQENTLSKAKKYFEHCQQCANTNSNLAILSKFYLSRIYIGEERYNEAEELLSELFKVLPQGHPLLVEMHYLKGTVAFKNALYQDAIALFEKAIPRSEDVYHPSWTPQALYQKEQCYLKLGVTR